MTMKFSERSYWFGMYISNCDTILQDHEDVISHLESFTSVFYAWCHVRNKMSHFGDNLVLRPQAEDKLTSTPLGTVGKTQKFTHVSR
jgi:hypothetical protein